MNGNDPKSHFEQFLASQVTATKPAPKEVEWARKRFSSRAWPPKGIT